MTPTGALALTGVALLLTAFVLGIAADAAGRYDTKRWIAVLAWSAFGLGFASLIGAAWWEALS